MGKKPAADPVSIHSCRRFDTLVQAEDHARSASKQEGDPRHVIHAGDSFFSSTTATTYWYERLLITYRNGVPVDNFLSEKDLSSSMDS